MDIRKFFKSKPTYVSERVIESTSNSEMASDALPGFTVFNEAKRKRSEDKQTSDESDEDVGFSKLENERKRSVLFTIPKKDFDEWPKQFVVVKDLGSKDIPGQTASFRAAVRQGILTILLKQPGIITNREDASTFAHYFPTDGFDQFLKTVRKDFKAVTANPGCFPTTNKKTNSPYAGYLLEFATAEERANFDLNLARENAGTPNRIFPHGQPMFASDLKKYVEGRKDELQDFMNRFFKSNEVYSRVNKWTPQPTQATGTPKRERQRTRVFTELRRRTTKSLLLAIPDENFNDWPSDLIVVSDMNNKDVPGQSAALRVAVRQGILTRLLRQPSIVKFGTSAEDFGHFFPTVGLDKFLHISRLMFRAITAKPGETSVVSSTNSPYTGYLLEFATEDERANFDLIHARENAEITNRPFLHGHPMFAIDLKSTSKVARTNWKSS